MGRKGRKRWEEEESMLEARKGVCVCVETAGRPIQTDKDRVSTHKIITEEGKEKKRNKTKIDIYI